MLKLTSSVLLTAALCLTAPASFALTKSECKAGYKDAMAQRDNAPAASADSLRALSDAGCARATGRLAHFYFSGTGVAQNTETARHLYQTAIDQGQTSAMVSLGKVLMRSGETEAAKALLEQAIEAGVRNAPAVHAWAHATRRYGTMSDPEQGWTTLAALAAEGDRTAELSYIAALTKTPNRRTRPDAILSQLHTRVENGDPKAAEALLRYYRMRGHRNGTPSLRKDLLATEGVRAKIEIEEGLYLARDMQGGQFWSASEAIVRAAPNDVFPRALVVTAKLNKNAYIRILQKELKHLGYNTGRPNGYLTARTIRSVNQFCRDTGIASECRVGPLKSSTIKAISAELAHRRQNI